MKATTTLLILSIVGSVYGHPSNVQNSGDDADLTVPQIIEKYGYPVKEYYVKTRDGYILNIHRIPHGKGSDKVSDKIVFLMHGILQSSADWVIAGPGKALPYLLADEGYDVWMGNARGNHHSRNHTYLDPDHSKKFWQFSWHEIGITDLPTMIDFALETTGQQKLFYIGHSQGTTTFYVMASERPEYNDKIRAQFSLAPVGFMKHLTSRLVRLLAPFTSPLAFLMKAIGVNEILPNRFIKRIGRKYCADGDIAQFLCTGVFYVIFGYSPSEMNATLLPTIFGHTPAGASAKQLVHYGQEKNSGHFRQYDYGFRANIKTYGHWSPPDYDLGKITAPVYLYYSRNDGMSAEIDVNKLYWKLANPRGKFLISDHSFSHLDYIFGIHAAEDVYYKIISLMTRH